MDLRHEPGAIGEARRCARERLDAWQVPIDPDEVSLLVSEAVTNAVIHGAPPATMHLAWDGRKLRVSVQDARVDALPVLRHAGAQGISGRGLGLVAALADRWGVEQTAESKVFWFEMRASG